LIGLVVLTAVTSLVVATISVWLVPVYMTAMVLIFAAPRSSRPTGAATKAEETPAAPPKDVVPPRADGVEGKPVEETPEVVVDPPASTEAVEPAPAKPRKRRAKARRGGKAAQAAEAAASEPTWIRVGPGKFVRADGQAAPADAETPTGAETTTQTAVDLPIQAEATNAADVDHDAEVEAVETPTNEDATPASPYEAEPSEVISPASFSGDEAETTEPDEEHGIAPSALAETWIPEAAPEDVGDDEPEPAAEPIEVEPVAEDENWSDARSEVVIEAGVEAQADEPEAGLDTPPAAVAPLATAASPISERLAPGERATVQREPTLARGVNLARRVSLPGKRLDRARPPRRHGAEARPTRSGRADRVRVRKADRGRRRSDPTGRRYQPRSPPRRA
jgi:hypothetical protein